MATLKFKIGDIVEFTFLGPRPSDKVWINGQNKGRGIVIDYNVKKNKYLVEITDPVNFSLGFSRSGSPPNKAWYFEEGALKMVKPAVSTSNIGDDDTQPIYFLPPPKKKESDTKKPEENDHQKMLRLLKGKDEGDGRLCPNPKCRAKMIPFVMGYCCPNGCDKKKPNDNDGEKPDDRGKKK